MVYENSIPEPWPFPDWGTPADQHIFNIPNKEPVQWSEFEDAIRRTGETAFVALEQKRYEECSVAPGPGNDVIVGTVLVVWSDPVITVAKQSVYNDWPQAHVGRQVENLFKLIPIGSTVIIITESSDVNLGFKHCYEQNAKGRHPTEYTTMQQWIWMMKTMRERGIQFSVNVLNEEEDMDCIKMSMLAIATELRR
jgi:hypothetical protein